MTHNLDHDYRDPEHDEFMELMGEGEEPTSQMGEAVEETCEAAAAQLY